MRFQVFRPRITSMSPEIRHFSRRWRRPLRRRRVRAVRRRARGRRGVAGAGVAARLLLGRPLLAGGRRVLRRAVGRLLRALRLPLRALLGEAPGAGRGPAEVALCLHHARCHLHVRVLVVVQSQNLSTRSRRNATRNTTLPPASRALQRGRGVRDRDVRRPATAPSTPSRTTRGAALPEGWPKRARWEV